MPTAFALFCGLNFWVLSAGKHNMLTKPQEEEEEEEEKKEFNYHEFQVILKEPTRRRSLPGRRVRRIGTGLGRASSAG